MSRGLAISCCALLALLVAGCESSQDKSARLAKKGGKAFTAKGLDVKHENPDVKVTATTVLHDKNGAATVVVLHNSGPTFQANVPISIDVLGPDGKSVFKNDAPGLEPSLVAAAYYLSFINVILYVYDRFTMPIALVLSLFGGVAFDALCRARTPLRMVWKISWSPPPCCKVPVLRAGARSLPAAPAP